MSRPLFSVGEEVIVVSDHYGRFESIIVKVRAEKKAGRDIITKNKLPPEFDYWLDPSSDMGDPLLPWPESRLRKKPKPSRDTFDQIIESINQGERVAV